MRQQAGIYFFPDSLSGGGNPPRFRTRFHLVSIGPERYNQLYPEFKNLNRFLAWGHATVIEGLVGKVRTARWR